MKNLTYLGYFVLLVKGFTKLLIKIQAHNKHMLSTVSLMSDEAKIKLFWHNCIP